MGAETRRSGESGSSKATFSSPSMGSRTAMTSGWASSTHTFGALGELALHAQHGAPTAGERDQQPRYSQTREHTAPRIHGSLADTPPAVDFLHEFPGRGLWGGEVDAG